MLLAQARPAMIIITLVLYHLAVAVRKFPIHSFLHNYCNIGGDRVHANAKQINLQDIALLMHACIQPDV